MRAGTRRGARWLAGVWAVAVVLAAVVMAGPAQAATAPFSDSAVAWTGHTAVVAAVNNAGNLDYYYQQDGSTTWNQEVVAKCCYGNSTPAIAQTGSTVSIVESGEGGQVDYYYEYDGVCLIQSLCPPGWHKEVVATAPSGTYYGPATISWTGSMVIIAADHALAGGSGAPTVLDYWYSDGGTGAWHEEQVATSVGYNGPGRPSIGWTGSAVIITDTDAHGNLDYWYQDAGTRPWHQQQVAPAGSLGNNGGGFWSFPVISWTGSTVIIAATNEDGDLDYWYQDAGTTPWHQEQVAGPGSVDIGGPAIAWTGSSVVLAGVTESGSLHFWVQAADTRPWDHEHVATLSQAGGEFFPPSMAAAGGHVVITDSDGSIHPVGGNLDYWWKRVGTTDWHQQQVAAG
jgi:hypothetical protein